MTPHPARRLRPGATIRSALVLGLTAMFALWLMTGYELLRSIADVEARVKAVHAAFVSGEETLSAIRTSVLLGSIYLRDALVDAADTRQYYREELRKTRTDIERRLPALSAAAEPDEQQEWRQLRQGLDDYWETLDLFLAPEAPLSYVQGTGVLRRQVVPARTNVLRIVDRLSSLQRLAQAQREEEASRLYAEVRSRLVAISAATLLIGAIVAWFVLRRTGVLERELHARRAAESENRRDLERLSARLVDAQEDERRNLARELHDEVGQALTAIKMEVGVALRAQGLDARGRRSLDEARAIAETTLHSVRDLSQLLHPSTLDDFGLPATLTAYVRSFAARTGIRVDLAVETLEARLAPEIEVAVYRIVQEALTNVARHSGASHGRVELTRDGDVLRLVIDDDGRGIDEAGFSRRLKGLGVIGMRERAQALAGAFRIEPRPGGGTRVRIVIPAPATTVGTAEPARELAG